MFQTRDLSENQVMRLQHVLEREFANLREETKKTAENSVIVSDNEVSEEEEARQVIVGVNTLFMTT